MVSLSCYDQFLVENSSVNQMHDSLALFEEIVNHPLLSNSNFILFLNKKDLFEEKMARFNNLRLWFPGYTNKTDGSIDSGMLSGIIVV